MTHAVTYLSSSAASSSSPTTGLRPRHSRAFQKSGPTTCSCFKTRGSDWAVRGAIAAQKLGCFEHYVEAIYVAMWEQERNMGEDSVIFEVVDKAGLDATGLLAAMQDSDVKARLLENTQRSYDRGAFGSPSFFIGDELFFGKDRLREVEEEIMRQQKQDPKP